APEAGPLPLVCEELPGRRRGVAEIDVVPPGRLALAGARLELGSGPQLLLFQRHDLPLRTHPVAAHGMHLEVAQHLKRRAHSKRCHPADPAKAALCDHAANLAGSGVLSAARSVAERARGLRRVSSSAGRIALDTPANVGAGPLPVSGIWRLPRAVAPAASRRNCFTIRSSRLWKATTARFPPARSKRSAACRPSRSSS